MSARPEDVIADALCMLSATDKHGRSIEAAAIATALRTAGLAIEQDWQPIETAPRDGRRLLCYAPATEDRSAVVRNDYWWVVESVWAFMSRVHPYTHWRPLPTPPEGQP